MGGWVTPRVRDAALRATERVSLSANRVFDDIDVLLTPRDGPPPARDRVIAGTGTVGASLRALPAIAYAAIWNVAGNPAAAVPRGLGPDGLPLSVQLVGPTDGEERLLSLSAQLERVAPWPKVAAAPTKVG